MSRPFSSEIIFDQVPLPLPGAPNNISRLPMVNSPSIKETLVVAHEHLRFKLIHNIHRHAD